MITQALVRPQPRLLDVRAVARYLGVSPATLGAWRRDGLGPTSIKVGGRIRYRPGDVEHWLSERTRQGA